MLHCSVPASLYSATNAVLPGVAIPSRMPDAAACVPHASTDAMPGSQLSTITSSSVSPDSAWPYLHSAEHASAALPNIANASVSTIATAAIVPGDGQSTVPDSLRLGLPDLRAGAVRVATTGMHTATAAIPAS